MFELQVLGPVVLKRWGLALPVRTHKALALLMLLALDGALPRDRVAAYLWPAKTESDGRRNLRRELARLREAGAADAVVSEGDMLALAPGVQCDAGLLVCELGAGRPDAALAHWHGPPADGLRADDAAPFDDWLAGQRMRLRAQRRLALHTSAAAREAAGDAEGALQRIDALLVDDELQEALHRDAMRLHSLCGRREAALAQYERCRVLLADELGLAPMAETEALAAELRGSLAVKAAPAAGHAAAADQAWRCEMPLLGRYAELSRLQTAWSAGRSLLIEGHAGIGKTRLACDFCAARGAYAMAQCRPGDREVPYASFTRALRALAGQSLAQAALPAWVTAELARVLPELGAAPAPIASAEDRRRFFEACAAAWAALVADSFDAVVVDDWHLADAPSRALFSFITRQRAEATQGGAREVFVFRPEIDSAARALLDDLISAGGAVQVQLGPLNPAQVLDLVRSLSGAPDPQRFAARLMDATGGNPFFVAETLRHWRELRLLTVGADGVWQTPFDDATADYLELPLPDSVREAVLARVRRLSDTARRILEAASLAAEPFAPVQLAGACALSEVEALAAIDEAVAAQLLHEREGGPHGTGYAFAHDLVQQALDGALAPERRRLVHRRLALGAEAAALAPTEMARHWEAGGEPRRAVVHRIAAAEAAWALFSDHDALAQWQAALDDQPTLEQRFRILNQRWALHRNHDDQPALMAAVADFDRLRDESLASPGAARVALDAAVEAATILSMSNRCAEALVRIDDCLAGSVPDVPRRARALKVRAQALNGVGRTAEAVASAQAALALGELEPRLHGDVLMALIYSHFLRNEPQPALEHARKSLALWQSAGARRSVARAHANIGMLLGMLGEQAAACAELEHAYAIAAEMHIVELQREVANNLADRYLHLGRSTRVIEVVTQAWELSKHFTLEHYPVLFGGMLVQAHWQRGELGLALGCAEEAFDRALALDRVQTLADCVSMALDVYTFIGDEAGAGRLVASLHGRSLDGYDFVRIKLTFNLVLHALRCGDLGSARAQLATLGEPQSLAQPVDQASAMLCHARLALTQGDAAMALRWLEPLRDDELHVETWALSCAVRLAAYGASGQPDAAAAARADAALASGRLPAPAALELQRARRQAALLDGDADTAERLRAQIAAGVQMLADSVHERPRQQALFLAAWG